jgi:hypothetical protein
MKLYSVRFLEDNDEAKLVAQYRVTAELDSEAIEKATEFFLMHHPKMDIKKHLVQAIPDD